MARILTPCLVALTSLLGTGGCAVEDDGVVALGFLLGPPPPAESRVLPPEHELGRPAFELRLARGRCDLGVAAYSVSCTFEGLPTPPRPSSGVRVYRLHLLVGDHPVHAGFDGHGIGYDPGGHDPDFPPPDLGPQPAREAVGVVTPDPLGFATFEVGDVDVPLSHVIGGEVRLHVPTGPDPEDPDLPPPPESYLILDGRLGNLVDGDEGDQPPRPVGDGHDHH